MFQLITKSVWNRCRTLAFESSSQKPQTAGDLGQPASHLTDWAWPNQATGNEQNFQVAGRSSFSTCIRDTGKWLTISLWSVQISLLTFSSSTWNHHSSCSFLLLNSWWIFSHLLFPLWILPKDEICSLFISQPNLMHANVANMRNLYYGAHIKT